MPTVAEFIPKTLPEKSNVKIQAPLRKNGAEKTTSNICQFTPKEVDMMPGQWATPFNPTPYELRVTIQTCKRLWKLNKAALEHPECDIEATKYNIRLLEGLYLQLMDYLMED